ncbi:tail fiber protein [Klebsiella phage VLCpiA1i]|nr:tail fiber protein [Klebsiella phage VLCpiA1i]
MSLTGLVKAKDPVLQLDYLRVSDVGTVGAGGDDTAVILAAIARANAEKKSLQFPERAHLKISGNVPLRFKYGADFNHSTLDVDDFTSKIYIERPTELQPYTLSKTSPEVQAIVTKGETLWGGLINAWANNTSLKNAYLVIRTGTNAFEYRNGIFKVVARNRLYRGGALAHNFDYPITPASIESIDVYPVPDYETQFGNLVVHRTSDPKDLFQVEHSRLKMHNIQCNHDGGLVSTGMIWINADNCFDVTYDSICTPFGNRYLSNPADPSSLLASYVFRFGDSYNVHLKNLHSNGLEWGTIGTDEVTNCLVEDCTLSRYDSHRPFHGYLVMVGCHFGARGLSVQGAGSFMLLERCDFLNNSINDYSPNNGLPFFINSRGDAGGFVDVDLIIRDCRFVNNLGQAVHVIAQTWAPDFSSGLPAGSPYRNVTFRTVTIENPVVQTDPSNSASQVDFGVREALTGGSGTPTALNTPDMPTKITLINVNSRLTGKAVFTLVNTRPASPTRAVTVLDSDTNPMTIPTNLSVVMRDCVWAAEAGVPVTLVDATGTYSADIAWDNVRNSSDSNQLSMRLFMPARMRASKSRIREIRPFYNGITLIKPMQFLFDSCEIYPPDTLISWDSSKTNHVCSLTGCSVLGDTMAVLAKVAEYRLSGCQYFLTGSGKVRVPITTSLASGTGTFLSVANLNVDNLYMLNTAQGDWPLRIPAPANAAYMHVGFTEDGATAKRIKFYRSSGTGGGIALTLFPADGAAPLPTFVYLP